MTKRVTVKDVARQAGLSATTVDRALNGRMKVRTETLRRIAEAAQAVGYHGQRLVEERLREDLPVCKLGFLLLDDAHFSFNRGLGARIEHEVRSLADARGQAVVRYVPWADANVTAKRLLELGKSVQAIAAISMDHPLVTAAVATLKSQGVPVFSLLSDFAAGVREGYVGLNNRKAGRAGGWFVARMATKPGKVSVMVGSNRFHGHEMREIGFRSLLRERAPHLEVIDTVVNPGFEAAAYEATKALLARHPDLVAINVAGFGPEGVIQAVRESDKAREIIVICNEATTESTEALAEEVVTLVIDTPLDPMCRDLVALMREAVHGEARQGQHFIQFNLLTPESL